MKPPGSAKSAFTVLEAVITLVLIAVLIALTFPAMERPHGSRMIQSLSNLKQLHLATQQMALDGTTTGDTNIGWPGDMGGSFAHWAQTLVASNYLATNDLVKLLSGPGKTLPLNKIPLTNNNAALVYAVKEESEGNVVFLSSGNFTNTPTGGNSLEANAQPYGNKGFVVFRKAGDGAILLPRQTGDTNIIGGYAPLCW